MTAATVETEYRALITFDTVPAGCIALACTGTYSQPHIRPGEFVVVDTKDRRPRNGEAYVIGWEGGRRNICQARITPLNPLDRSGVELCSVGAMRNPQGRAALKACLDDMDAMARTTGKVQTFPGWTEGRFEPDHLAEKLEGCVIGLYAPISRDRSGLQRAQNDARR